MKNLVFLFFSFYIPIKTLVDWNWEDRFRDNIEWRTRRGRRREFNEFLLHAYVISLNPHRSPMRQVLPIIQRRGNRLSYYVTSQFNW